MIHMLYEKILKKIFVNQKEVDHGDIWDSKNLKKWMIKAQLYSKYVHNSSFVDILLHMLIYWRKRTPYFMHQTLLGSNNYNYNFKTL